MDKQQYFNLSAKRKVPFRCPILDLCERRLLSIYFINFLNSHNGKDWTSFLVKNGVTSNENLDKKIKIVGEEPSVIPGRSMFAYENLCPEVNLFDNEYAYYHAKGTASTRAEYDEFRNGEKKFINYDFRHFTECAEFNSCIPYLNRTTQKSAATRRRIGISNQLRFEIFQRDKYTCQYCGRSKDDGAVLHLDHKVSVDAGGKDEYSNLITSCRDCNLGKSNKII